MNKKLYPIEVEIKIHITDGNGQTGTATYRHGFHKLPTESDMPAVLKKTTAALPDGFRLMTRTESTNFVIGERFHTTEKFALTKLPEGEVWHDANSAND
jgi:hypothetical protein